MYMVNVSCNDHPVLRPPEEVKSRADVVDRWLHDLYEDSKQGPREQWEKDRVKLYVVTF